MSVIAETRADAVSSFAAELEAHTEGVAIVIGGAALKGMTLPAMGGVTFVEDWRELSID